MDIQGFNLVLSGPMSHELMPLHLFFSPEVLTTLVTGQLHRHCDYSLINDWICDWVTPAPPFKAFLFQFELAPPGGSVQAEDADITLWSGAAMARVTKLTTCSSFLHCWACDSWLFYRTLFVPVNSFVASHHWDFRVFFGPRTFDLFLVLSAV